jgi:hypothetical protein
LKGKDNFFNFYYAIILATTHEPTVLPHSLMANLNHSVIAIGACNSIVIWMLSHGITISTPAGNSTFQVTSVVLK